MGPFRLRVRSAGILFLLGQALCSASAATDGPTLIDARKIWDIAPHNAFTDLLRRHETWFCVFREGSGHIPGSDGTIRVLKSSDGDRWTSTASLAEPGIDLRDPKISLMPDGRLMLVMGGSYYSGDASTPKRTRTNAWSRVSFSTDGTAWTTPRKIEGPPAHSWLWRVTWHGDTGYGAVYTTGRSGNRRQMSVWRTRDGAAYERIAAPDPGIDLSEFTIRFLPDDTMAILLRGEEKDRHAWIGSSRPPYADWSWQETQSTAQGPNFLVLGDGRMFYAGRNFESNAAHLAFGRMTLTELKPELRLPSGGDCSYPGLAMADAQTFWMSYYASHEGKAAIYLARIHVP